MRARGYELPARYADSGAAIIQMRGIVKVFHSAAGAAMVLKGIDIDIPAGQFVSVVGRSGSGKSTLVNMITGIDHPTSGSVEIGGRPILEMQESEMAVWRGKNLGIVFQFFQLLPMLTLVENVMLPMDFCNVYPPAEREKRAVALLRRVGLDDLAYALPGAVAGGQQQSAAVARALANDPPILIADEPTGNLDSTTAGQVMGIFEELATQGKTILLVTHDRSLAKRTQRRLLICDGELVNEALVASFPDAPHELLLRLSHAAHPLELRPGALLPMNAAAPVYLVTRGEMLAGQAGPRFSTGSLLDPVELRSPPCAGSAGAALLSLPRSLNVPMDLPPAGAGQRGQP